MDAVPPHTFSQKGVYYQEQQLEAELVMGCTPVPELKLFLI